MTFNFRKKKPILTPEETQQLVVAIRDAELQTSGEIRVFIERKCKYVDALDRAEQVFVSLEMERTKLRNGVLFYVAIRDKQLAIFGDEGIHKEVGKTYWNDLLQKLIATIKQGKLVNGLSVAITEVGKSLKEHFPYDAQTDKNELPDDIVFGN